MGGNSDPPVPAIVAIHHLLMAKYGWIPYEEFKSLPADVVFNLIEMIKFQDKMERRPMRR